MYNLQPTAQTVQFNLGVIDTPGITDVITGEVIPQADQFHPVPVDLWPYGYRFFTVLSRNDASAEIKKK